MIRLASTQDIETMVSIYNQAIEDRVSANCDVLHDGPDRFRSTYFCQPAYGPVLVSTSKFGDEITGWGAIKKFSARPADPGLGEIAVYVGRSQRGGGQGIRLLKALLDAAPDYDLRSLVAVILGRNAPSIRGATGCGFREVVRLASIAEVDGHPEDVVWMHKFLDQ